MSGWVPGSNPASHWTSLLGSRSDPEALLSRRSLGLSPTGDRSKYGVVPP